MEKQFNRTIASILIVAIVSGCATTATTVTTTPQAASNTEWKLLAVTNEGDKVHGANVLKLLKNRAEIVSMTNLKQPTSIKLTDGSTALVNSILRTYEFDCNPSSLRELTLSFWTEQNGKGTKHAFLPAYKWTPITENTVGGKLYAEACNTTTVQAPSVPSSATPAITTSDVSDFIGGTFSVIGGIFSLISAVAVPFANGYYTQKNENTRNNSGTKSAPNYSCQDLGMGSASCVAY